MKAGRITVGTWVPVKIHAEIRRRANAEGTTVSQWLKDLIVKHLQRNPE